MSSFDDYLEEPIPERLAGPKVFLSHSSIDVDFTRRLEAALRSKPFRVWVDHSDITPGDSIPSAINTALAAADIFVPIMTPHYVNSRWCTAELDAFIMRLHSDSSVFAIPILLTSCDIPPLLRSIQYVDFTDSFDSGFLRLADTIADRLGEDWPAVLQSTPTSTPTNDASPFVDVVVIFGTSGERRSYRLPLNLYCNVAARQVIGDLYLAELPEHRREGYLADGNFSLFREGKHFGQGILTEELHLKPGDEIRVASHHVYPWHFDAAYAQSLFRARERRLALRPILRFYEYVRETVRRRLESDGEFLPPA